VVLATGGMARPRMLGVPGENLPHVSTSLGDPHRYFRTRLLIVGGRNSAVEAALRCWRVGVRVSVSYRRGCFNPECVKPHLFAEVNGLIRDGQIAFYPETTVERIEPCQVVLTRAVGPEPGRRTAVQADFVLKCLGFEADMALFRGIGIDLSGPDGAPVHSPETMETNVRGVYVAGTAASGTQERFQTFIETSHEHVVRIVTDLSRQLGWTSPYARAHRPQLEEARTVGECPPEGAPPSEQEDMEADKR
jgi:thioredoxin reductase (NADPH)